MHPIFSIFWRLGGRHLPFPFSGSVARFESRLFARSDARRAAAMDRDAVERGDVVYR